MLPLPKLRITLIGTLLSLAAAAANAQTTIHVPTDQPTIQSAINAANPGDTVLVAPGTYFENIDFLGKAITVTSSGGAAATIIDGGAKGPTVTFKTAEPRTAVLSQFTIQHGGVFDYTVFANGGIYLNNSAPTILNNVLTQNNCWTIYSMQSGPLLQGNEISATQDPNGQCSFGGGAGVYISGDFIGETEPASLDIPADITGNTIENNVESGLEDAGGNGGAAVAVWGGSPVIENNILRNNASPGGSGGAINVESGVGVVIVQNLIYGNSAGCGGGALAFMGFPSPATGISVLIANNTIVNNTDQGFPGGYSECATISQIYPSPDTYGGSNPDVSIVNNILSGSTTYPAVNCSWFDTPSLSIQPTFAHNILHNAGGPFFGSYCVDVSGQDNNVTADPQFVNSAANDYHLQSSSPAIDAGDNNVVQTFLTMAGLAFMKDLDGNPRVQDATHKGTAIIDMGAYEYAGTLDSNSVTEILTSSLNPSTYGTSVTFSASLTSTTGIPTGSVEFKDGTSVLGVQTVSATGTSSYSTAALSVGTHPITAVYEPTGVFTAATASLSQVVTGTTTASNTTLTCTPSTIPIGATSLFSAMVTASSGTPTGSITFTDNGTTLAQPTLTNGDASLTYTGQVTGTHNIIATYVPTGSFTASSASCAVAVDLLPSTAILSVVPTSSTFGNPVTLTATVSATNPPGPSVPTGSVTFTYNTATNPAIVTLGTVSLTAGVASLTTTTLPVGEDNLNCTYTGDSVYAPATCISQGVGSTGPAFTLTSSLNPAPALTPITFTAQLGPGNSGGTIVFDINGQTITTTPNAYGTAITTISTLTPGSYLIIADWFAPGHSLAVEASLTQVITAPIAVPDFSLNATNVTFKALHSGAGGLELASLNNFRGNVTLTCDPPYPPYYSCSLQESNIPLMPNYSTAFSFTLSPILTANTQRSAPLSRVVLASLFPLTLLSLFGLTRKRRTTLRALLSLTLLAILASATTACGPDHFIPITTGTFPITFTATGTSQGTSTPITHTVTISATITP